MLLGAFAERSSWPPSRSFVAERAVTVRRSRVLLLALTSPPAKSLAGMRPASARLAAEARATRLARFPT